MLKNTSVKTRGKKMRSNCASTREAGGPPRNFVPGMARGATLTHSGEHLAARDARMPARNGQIGSDPVSWPLPFLSDVFMSGSAGHSSFSLCICPSARPARGPGRARRTQPANPPSSPPPLLSSRRSENRAAPTEMTREKKGHHERQPRRRRWPGTSRASRESRVKAKRRREASPRRRRGRRGLRFPSRARIETRVDESPPGTLIMRVERKHYFRAKGISDAPNLEPLKFATVTFFVFSHSASTILFDFNAASIETVTVIFYSNLPKKSSSRNDSLKRLLHNFKFPHTYPRFRLCFTDRRLEKQVDRSQTDSNQPNSRSGDYDPSSVVQYIRAHRP